MHAETLANPPGPVTGQCFPITADSTWRRYDLRLIMENGRAYDAVSGQTAIRLFIQAKAGTCYWQLGTAQTDPLADAQLLLLDHTAVFATGAALVPGAQYVSQLLAGEYRRPIVNRARTPYLYLRGSGRVDLEANSPIDTP